MKTAMPTVLLLGDSLIEYGDWQMLLPEYVTINRGVAGETTGGLSARLAWELENSPGSDHIVIFSGTNDLLMGDSYFPAIFSTMLTRLRMLVAEADISVIGIAPMRLPWISEAAFEEVNRALRETVHSAGCRFLDLTENFALLCRPIGNPCFLPDGVHFSPHGYQVLAESVRQHLESVS